jgi:hypothetical protein
MDSFGSKYGNAVGSCEYGNEPSVSRKTLKTSWPVERPSASQEMPCSTEPVCKPCQSSSDRQKQKRLFHVIQIGGLITNGSAKTGINYRR